MTRPPGHAPPAWFYNHKGGQKGGTMRDQDLFAFLDKVTEYVGANTFIAFFLEKKGDEKEVIGFKITLPDGNSYGRGFNRKDIERGMQESPHQTVLSGMALKMCHDIKYPITKEMLNKE